MEKSKFVITSKQLIYIILGAMTGTGILSLPRVVSADARQDAWIPIILGATIPILSLFLIERLGRRFPEDTFVGISQKLFGKYIGAFLVVIFVLYVIGFESIVLRRFAEITTLYMLPRTPIWVILLLVLGAVVYIAGLGAKVVGRINELLFYILVLIILLTVPAIGLGDFTNMLPVGGSGLTGILKGSLSSVFAFAGIEVLIVTYSMVTRKEEVIKAGVTAIVIGTILYLIVTIVCLLVYGHDVLQKLFFPVLVLLKVINIPVVERLEFFFLAFWLVLGARPTITLGMAAAYSMTNLMKLDKAKHYLLVLVTIGLGMYILAIIPKDLIQVLQLTDYAGYGFPIIALGYPLLYHLAALLRKEKIKNV